MSKLANRRKKMGYTVKRCATCKHFKPPYVYLTTNSESKMSKPLCLLGEFTIAPHGLCKEWEPA
jgi:hypothetical protein